ncbi:hypothetical protein EOL70_05740 [Leucothrix sargassi]|nr:hypothetical protein EOL70_05740 [Leucothrix sargassi]
MLVDTLHYFLIILSVLATLATFSHIRGLRRTGEYSSEQLFIFMFCLLAAIAFGYFILKAQVNKLEVSDDEHYRSEKELFIEQTYPPLFVSQKQLYAQIDNLSDLQKQIVALRDNHPQQKDRLESVYAIWNQERKRLVNLKTELERAVHKAWTEQNSRNSGFVDSQFSREAVDWDKVLKRRLAEYENAQIEVTNTMLDNVIEQRQALSELSPVKGAPELPSGQMRQTVFSAATVKILAEALALREPKRVALLDSMNKEVSYAAQRRREVRNYALDKPNFQVALRRVMDDYFALENEAVYYRDQVLHAVQADYLARILGVNQRDNQMIRLEREIGKKLPVLLDDLNTTRLAIDKSYQFAPEL